ncbi:hypothetical protein MUK42_13412 [Musa troglodytarum]|uniref:Rab-GAP TBC domain-containing protein n=1 Tax=Musa troglodytarum TaxID=320322 RepID=A0A9E7I4M6_9LILI|nr:hypothetical protein MUK42_13412 [Musa troglodytarum]
MLHKGLLVELLDSPLHNYFKQADCLNYFFCFRWILIQFKREFEYDQVTHLWEVLWTHYLSEHLHLYMCVAILKSHRKKIMGEQMDFDTLLKFINELSGNIDLDWTIREAEALCICAGENGAASIPPGTPPSLPIEPDMGLYPQEDEYQLRNETSFGGVRRPGKASPAATHIMHVFRPALSDMN